MSSRDSGIALESVAINKKIQYGGLGESTWLDLLFILYEWPSQTVHFTPERNYDYLGGRDQNRTGKYKNSGTRFRRQKTHKQENTDEKI